VMICAPHTSYWDGFWMLGCASILGIDLRFLGKHTMFKGPLGWLLKGLGAVPVIRSQRQNTVQQAAEWFRSSDAFLLGVAPEGTRKLTEGWKTGFYWIAMEAKVPIVCAFIDYGTKTGGFTGDVIQPTDGILGIGSGGSYAVAAARALVAHSTLDAGQIVRQSLEIAAGIDIYTNEHILVEELECPP